MSMLVSLPNVTVTSSAPQSLPRGSGRDLIYITADTSQDAPAIDNELFDLGCPIATCTDAPFKAMYPAGMKFTSVTGIMTYFISFHISPRTLDDLVIAFAGPSCAKLDTCCASLPQTTTGLTDLFACYQASRAGTDAACVTELTTLGSACAPLDAGTDAH